MKKVARKARIDMAGGVGVEGEVWCRVFKWRGAGRI